MAEQDKHAAKDAVKPAPDTRQKRLADVLRSNLKKRKEGARARRSMPKGTEEGGQG
ncbi:MAG: hypothetical protein AAF405_09040 [Pseudomonadota bacterium]